MEYWINENYYYEEKKELVILQAAFEKSNIDIPCFCYHESLNIAGNCRMCLVEVSNSLKLVASCAMPIVNNMRIYTNTFRVKKARESVLEFLLVNHPLDCPICDQGGECDLQDITLIFGSDKSRFYEYNKRAVLDKNIGNLVKMIMTRCIHRTRCVRFLNEICDNNDLGILGRGNNSEISNYILKNLSHELSGNIIDLCPVGALTSKPYSFTARSWELNSLESIDIFDSMCSSIRIDFLNNNIMRILPVYNKFINEDWITNKIRFIYDCLNNFRLNFPNIKWKNKFLSINWLNMFNIYTYFFKKYVYLNNNIIIILGNLVDLNTNLENKWFFNQLGLEINLEDFFFNFQNDFDNDYFLNNIFFDNLNILIIVGLNLRIEMPLMFSKIKKINVKKIFSFGLIYSINEKKIFCRNNNLLSILDILRGKNEINKEMFFLNYVNLSFFSKKNYVNIYILLGLSFYKNYINNFEIYIYLKKYLFKYFLNSKIYNVFSSVGYLNYLNSNNLSNKIDNFYNSFIHCESFDDFLKIKKFNIKKNSFLVYKGCFFDNYSHYISLIVPSLSYCEENLNFLNIYGENLLAKKVLSNKYFIYSNKEFLKILSYYFFKFNIYLKILKIIKYFKDLFFLNKIIKYKKNNVQFDRNVKNIKFKNYILNSLKYNFYKMDIYSKNSIILQNSSLEYLKNLKMYY